MEKQSDLDLIIVGQGLAGSAVAMRALFRGYRIKVFDRPDENRSSAVAAGLFNPVAGRVMSKAWLAEELFPELFTFYPRVEAITGSRFFHEVPIYRPFISVAEQNEWLARSAEPGYTKFLEKVSPSSAFGTEVNDPLGGIRLKCAGYIDTGSYLVAVRRHLQALGAYHSGFFNPEELVDAGGRLGYRGLQARKVIFCQGVWNRDNPWFQNLPVRPLKGEFLTIQCEWNKHVILNRGVYMVPASGPNHWRVGATYNREDLSAGSTEAAREEIIHKLEALVRMPYGIIDQQWGFRPTSPDRKPILGAHADHPSLIIFNGLGTKGVSLAPYFSEVLFRWMENEGTIGKEADVTRFY